MAKPDKAGKGSNVIGVVTAVDTASVTLETKSKGPKKPGSSKTFALNSSTKVTKDDTVVQVDQIAVGDWVTLKELGGTATRVAVHDVDDDDDEVAQA